MGTLKVWQKGDLMLIPIKLNIDFWPRILTKYLPSIDDPRILCSETVSDEVIDSFSEKVSVFKFGKTFKTTQSNRHKLSNLLIKEKLSDQIPTILDIGASDGVTSLDLIKKIPFNKFYVTDLNLHIYFTRCHNKVFFYNESNECILAVSEKFVYYLCESPSLWIFRVIFGYLKSQYNSVATSDNRFNKVDLIHPELIKLANKDARVIIKRFNIFDKWNDSVPDLVKVANVLNRVYFSDEQIKLAVNNIFSLLNIGGRVLIIDNRDDEKATLFKKTWDSFKVEETINGGTEISSLVLNHASFI